MHKKGSDRLLLSDNESIDEVRVVKILIHSQQRGTGPRQ
jgi:hypothetical protein